MDAEAPAISVIALSLFLAALSVNGITHGIFLEAGIFMALKPIGMPGKNPSAVNIPNEKLDVILKGLDKKPVGQGKA